MDKPEDTSKRYEQEMVRSATLGVAVGRLMAPGSIEAMERAGQAQLVASESLPSEVSEEDRAAMEALGFEFAQPFLDDPLFMQAKLPAGWSKKGSDHAMWSYVVDAEGRERVAVFYKAAFYDRRAFMRLENGHDQG